MTTEEAYAEQRLWELGSTGVTVEEDVLKIVKRIRDMDPNLDVQYLDPGRFPDLTDAPYRVIEYGKTDHIPRVVFTTWVLDERVIKRLQMCDTIAHDVLKSIDDQNAIAKMNREQRFKEERLECMDIVKSVFKSPKGTFTFHRPVDNKLVKIDDSP